MRFLKDIIAKRMHQPEEQYPDDQDDLESEFVEDQWDEDEDEDQFADDYPEDSDETEFDETFDPQSFAESETDDDHAVAATRPLSANSDESPANGAASEDEVVNIWDMFDEDEAVAEDPEPVEAPVAKDRDLAREALKAIVVPPPPSEAAPTQRAGRVKTRMLGFHSVESGEKNVFDRSVTKSKHANDRFPVGWLVLIEGPGRGTSFTLHYGVSSVGRGEDQTIRLDFGDTSISRENHAAIAYDEDLNSFYLGHGGKSNLVRLNGRPVLSTEELSNADLIRIGETTLRFVSFCSAEFAWDLTDDQEVAHARAS